MKTIKVGYGPIALNVQRTNWGGARTGSGRKPSTPDTTQVNWRVSERAKRWMKWQAMEQGVSIATILDLLIDVFEEKAL